MMLFRYQRNGTIVESRILNRTWEAATTEVQDIITRDHQDNTVAETDGFLAAAEGVWAFPDRPSLQSIRLMRQFILD